LFTIPEVVEKIEKGISYISPLSWLYSRPYRQVVRREMELASVNSDATVLNIGCGAVPFTARFVVQQTGAGVIAVDTDSRAVDRASRLVQTWGMADRIELRHVDATKLLDVDFDLALVALQAQPKTAIFERLSEIAPAGRAIFRRPAAGYQDHYDALPEQPRPAAYVEQDMKTFDRSVLYDL